jgi:hypothetical protein
MPSISITIGGLGRTREISGGDLNGRLLPALRYLASANPSVVDPANDLLIIQEWADAIINSLNSAVESYEEFKSRETRTQVFPPLIVTQP